MDWWSGFLRVIKIYGIRRWFKELVFIMICKVLWWNVIIFVCVICVCFHILYYTCKCVGIIVNHIHMVALFAKSVSNLFQVVGSILGIKFRQLEYIPWRCYVGWWWWWNVGSVKILGNWPHESKSPKSTWSMIHVVTFLNKAGHRVRKCDVIKFLFFAFSIFLTTFQ